MLEIRTIWYENRKCVQFCWYVDSYEFRLDWNEDEALTDEWRKDWAAYFTVTRQVIYARVSGRERTGHRGSLLFAIEDLITITRYTSVTA